MKIKFFATLLVAAAMISFCQDARAACSPTLAGSAVAEDNGTYTCDPFLGIIGSYTGTLTFAGATSGSVKITPQSTAGTSVTLTLPNTSGTLASGATSPLSLNAATGALSIGNIPNSAFATMAARTVKCNDTTSSAAPTDCDYPIVNVKDFGATGNGSTDDTTAIQNAINALPASGGDVIFPVGNYKTSGLTIGNGNAAAASTTLGVRLKGVGNPNAFPHLAGFTATSGPKLTLSGGTSIISINGPLQGWGVENLFLDCASVASSIGLLITSAQFGDVKNVTFNNCSAAGIKSTTVDPFGSFTNTDSFHNNFTNIAVQVPAVASAKGIFLTGNSSSSDTDFNLFMNTTVSLPSSGAVFGIYHQISDTNTFVETHVLGGNASAKSVVFDYNSSNSFPLANAFIHFDVLQSGGGTSFSNSGTPGSGAKPNYLIGFGEANGDAPPSVANLAVYSSDKIILSPGGNTSSNQWVTYDNSLGAWSLVVGGTSQFQIGSSQVTSKEVFKTILNSTAITSPAAGQGLIAQFQSADGANTIIEMDATGTGAAPTIQGLAARGTAGSQTASQSGDQLLNMAGFGYGQTGYSVNSKAKINFQASEAWSDTAQGTLIGFFTTKNTTTTRTQVATLDGNGHLGYTVVTAPTANSCAGFSLATGATDTAGKVSFTSATSCSINFGSGYTTAPFCSVMPGSAASTVTITTSTSGLSATFGTAQTSMFWQCFGN